MVIHLQRQESWSRGQLLLRTFLSPIYFLPHIFCLLFLSFAATFIGVLNAFCILFTGQVPESFYDFIYGFQAWRLRLAVRNLNLCDGYPEFGLHGGDALLEFGCERREWYSRLSVLLRLLLGWLIIIPHSVVLYFLGIAVVFIQILGFFSILFTGSLPQGFFGFSLGFLRWQFRVQNYFLFLIGTAAGGAFCPCK